MGQLHEFGDGLQPWVARQADDVVHIGTFAVVDDALTAKARVTAKHDAHLGPLLAQPLDQQFQNGRAVLGPIDAAGSQVGAQQLLAAEDVQRQVAVGVVVAVEELALLLAVQRVVGGVKVEHQLFGGALEAGDELLDQHLVQTPGGGFIGPFLQPAQRGGAGHLPVYTDCRLHGHVAAQCAVVVQVFPAECQAVHALAQHVGHAVRDQQRVARVGDAARCGIEQAQLAVSGPQQHHASVTGHGTAVKTPFDDSPAKTAKFDLAGLNFFGTVWHWQSLVVIGLRYQ